MAVPIISELTPTLAGLFDFTGVAQVGNVTETASPGGFTPGNIADNRLIQTDQRVDFKFEWKVKGMFAHTINPNFQWKIEIFMEKYGPGELNLGGTGVRLVNYGTGDLLLPDEVRFPGVASPTSTTVTLPGGTVTEGVYDIVAVISLLHDAPSNTPCFIAAFAEFGKISFYQEH